VKIDKIETVPVRLRLKEAFKESPGVYDELMHVIVKIWTDEGIVGLGEACPTPPADEETVESVLYAVRKYIEPAVAGEDPFNIERIITAMDWLPVNTYAKSAIDMAVYDIMGKKLNIPVYMLLGGCYRTRIPGGWEIGIDKPEKNVKDAEKAVERGFMQLKIKMGLDLSADVERFKRIRKAVGYDVAIAADANQGWKTYEAVRAIKKIEKYEPAFIEQPVARWDITGLAEVCRSVDTPIMPDESLRTPQDALNLVRNRAAECFNLKIPKHGGLYNSKKITTIAEIAGISCMVGTMWELGIAAAAGFHLAASAKIIDLRNEIIEGPIRAEAHLLSEPLDIEKGYFQAPKGPGLGVELDEHELKKYAEAFQP